MLVGNFLYRIIDLGRGFDRQGRSAVRFTQKINPIHPYGLSFFNRNAGPLKGSGSLDGGPGRGLNGLCHHCGGRLRHRRHLRFLGGGKGLFKLNVQGSAILDHVVGHIRSKKDFDARRFVFGLNLRRLNRKNRIAAGCNPTAGNVQAGVGEIEHHAQGQRLFNRGVGQRCGSTDHHIDRIGAF